MVASALIAAAVVARGFFHGERLASFVTGLINADIRGRVSASSIEWPWSSLPASLAGGWTDVTLRDVEVYDHDGTHVLHAPVVTGQMRLGSLLLRGDFRFRHIAIADGWTLLREAPSPYPPASEPDATDPTLVSAFESREPPASPRERREAGPTWDLQSFAVSGIDLELDFDNFHALAKDVSGTGWLHYAKRAGDPRQNKFLAFHVGRPQRTARLADHPRPADDRADRRRRCAARAGRARQHRPTHRRARAAPGAQHRVGRDRCHQRRPRGDHRGLVRPLAEPLGRTL